MLDFRLTPTGSCILCKPLFHLPLAAPILIILHALAKKLDVFMKMDFTEKPQGSKNWAIPYTYTLTRNSIF